MDRPPKDIVARLGRGGLARALGDLLDQRGLVAAANAAGLHYPGMRTQSQTRARLLADLAERAETHEEAQKVVARTLAKKAARQVRDWKDLPATERTRRLADEAFLLARANLGLHLYLIAAGPGDDETERAALARLIELATRGSQAPAGKRPEARAERHVRKQDKKLQYLEGQLAKLRETLREVKGDLIQRKGELAESRMLAERLRRELAQAQSAPAATPPAAQAPAGEAEAATAKTLRKLAAEQKKILHLLDRQADRPAGREPAADLGPLLEVVDVLRHEIAAEGDARRRELAAQTKRIESRLAELRARDAAATAARPRRPAARGAGDRVGVFIDVQNMYYGARQLKGKLDFDALLAAAVSGRRLIKATAYVVESKETDQSQFIAVLEKRGIEVRRKTLQVRADGSMKGDWDMELALDILDAAGGLDVVVLVSGDGDFTSLVQRVKGMGPRVEVVAFPRATAKSLAGAADHFQPLDRKFMIYEPKPKPDPEPAPAPPVAAGG